MVGNFKYDVFLSHGSKDKAIVRALAKRLRADGLRVLFEDREIDPRTTKAKRKMKMVEGLGQARILVLCLSENVLGFEWKGLESSVFRFSDLATPGRHLIFLYLDKPSIKFDTSYFEHLLARPLYVKWLPEDRQYAYKRLLEKCKLPQRLQKWRSAQADLLLFEPGQQKVADNVIQLRYKGGIRSYVFTPDGRRVLTSARDGKIRLWDLKARYCLSTFEGHGNEVNSVAWNADQRYALSGADDKTVRLWDIESYERCLRVLEGHTGQVWDIAWGNDKKYALSGSSDKTIRLWDVEIGRCLRVYEGHMAGIWSVQWSADQQSILSGSADKTVRVWDAESGRCLRVFEGHTEAVRSVAWITDQSLAFSGSDDKTLRAWDMESGRCLHVFEGHTGPIESVVWIGDLQCVLSGSTDKTVRVWDISTGLCVQVLYGHDSEVESVAWNADQRCVFSGDRKGGIRIWNLEEFVRATPETRVSILDLSDALDQSQYTNAKVLVVGESGAGKTGLTERLAHDTFTPSYSTSGTWSTQWKMKDFFIEPGWEREIWLWDFGGQADQRLIHQLYVDKAALILLLFNANRDLVLPGLRDWQQALSRCVPENTRTYLVAGRIDVGFNFDREKVRAFAQQHGYEYFETSANDGKGCPELRRAIQEGISWTQLERRTSPSTWKLLKDEILKLRDEEQTLFTFKELRETLRQRLAAEATFVDQELETVVNLLDGPGVVKELSFGTYVVLRPEWINVYAQAVIRTLRADEKNLGCLPVQSIAAGKLIFQTQQAGGEIVEEKRLDRHEETIVLQAMEQMLLERMLCLRQEGYLVFPSYCGIEKPLGPVPPRYFIRYVFGGFLDDIYATLVVKLVYCGAFKLKELWRDAADFETLVDQRTMGVKLLRNEDGRGTLLVHYGKGVPIQEQVIFANYIHEHLIDKAVEAERQRYFICPHCETPVTNHDVAMRRLEEFGREAQIICVNCEEYIPLWDALEERFASEEVRVQVALLQKRERIELDSRRKGKLLALEVAARITRADQKCFEIPGVEDEGIDMEVEFTRSDGRGSGKRVYLQLKAGNSYLERRKSDGAEIFRIKKQRWVEYWLEQNCPVFLVIGTFPEEAEEFRGGREERFAEVRWMEVGELLLRESDGGKKAVKQIVFNGERLDVMSVLKWRKKVLGRG